MTPWPACASTSAAIRPAGPAPMMATWIGEGGDTGAGIRHVYVIPGHAASRGPQMCNCTSGNLEIPGSPAAPRDKRCALARGMTKLLPINRLRIEHLVRVHERQPRPAFAAGIHLPVEAGAPAGVAGGARLLDPDPDRVLIAIHPHLDHALDVAGGFAFSPQ